MKLLRYLPRFRRAYREMERLAERETWSRAQIEAWQLQRLNGVWRHAAQHVPYYRRLAQERQLPREFGTLGEFRALMPVLTKSVIREQPRSLLSERAERGRWRRTGGSTATPMSCYWSRQAHFEMLRAKYRFHAMWGVDVLDRVAVLWGHQASFQPGLRGALARWRQPWEDRLRNRLRLSAYRLTRESLREYLRRIADFRPAMLYGYALAMGLLADEAEASGFRSEALKLFVMTSETVFDRYVEVAETVFGVPAVCEYGAIEAGFLAGEGPDRTLRVREDVVFLETLPLEAGRQEIVVSVLNNPSFPLLRYAIGDATDAPLTTPSHGFARLSNVAGRLESLIVTRRGAFLHPAHIDSLVKHRVKHVRRYRVHQQRDGGLAVGVELDDGGSFDADDLRRSLAELVDGFPVEVRLVDELPATAAGKHQAIVSDHELVRARAARVATGRLRDTPGAKTSDELAAFVTRPTAPARIIPPSTLEPCSPSANGSAGGLQL